MSISKDAIEAAARAIADAQNVPFAGRKQLLLARAALTAAAPFIQAAAVAEAMEKLAVKFEATASCASYIGTEDIMETWLNAAQRARAATIAGETK